jgi:hypothetical protein
MAASDAQRLALGRAARVDDLKKASAGAGAGEAAAIKLARVGSAWFE